MSVRGCPSRSRPPSPLSLWSRPFWFSAPSEEADFFALVCFRAGDASAVDDQRPASLVRGSARAVDLMVAVSHVMGIAIEITRLRRYTDRLQDCLDSLSATVRIV